MNTIFLKNLQSDDYIYIQSDIDLQSYKEMLLLPDDITGLILEAGSIENGSIEPDDKIYMTESNRPYDLNAGYTEVTYKEWLQLARG